MLIRRTRRQVHDKDLNCDCECGCWMFAGICVSHAREHDSKTLTTIQATAQSITYGNHSHIRCSSHTDSTYPSISHTRTMSLYRTPANRSLSILPHPSLSTRRYASARANLASGTRDLIGSASCTLGQVQRCECIRCGDESAVSYTKAGPGTGIMLGCWGALILFGQGWEMGRVGLVGRQ
jgi:hypothetical protein